AIALLLATGAGMGLWLLRRPPRTAAAAAGVSAVGLLAAMMLLPATRFGYLLYPAALALWAPALLLPPATEPDMTHPAIRQAEEAEPSPTPALPGADIPRPA